MAELYRPGGIYMYGNKYGTNWRAAVAFNIGWIPLLPGFAQSVSPQIWNEHIVDHKAGELNPQLEPRRAPLVQFGVLLWICK